MIASLIRLAIFFIKDIFNLVKNIMLNYLYKKTIWL